MDGNDFVKFMLGYVQKHGDVQDVEKAAEFRRMFEDSEHVQASAPVQKPAEGAGQALAMEEKVVT